MRPGTSSLPPQRSPPPASRLLSCLLPPCCVDTLLPSLLFALGESLTGSIPGPLASTPSGHLTGLSGVCQGLFQELQYIWGDNEFLQK